MFHMELNRFSIQRLTAKKNQEEENRGYLWLLRNARMGVQSQHLVEIEEFCEAKSKGRNQKAQLMSV